MTESLSNTRMDTGGVPKEVKESSWSDMIKAVDSQRKTLPWNPKEVSPVKRISLVERRLEERETNPVLMQYREPAREQKRSDEQLMKSAAVISRVNNIKKTTFNFLSHQGPPRQIDLHPRPICVPERERHLLTHLLNNDHLNTTIKYDEEKIMEQLKNRTPIERPPAAFTRDFSITTNIFNKDHNGVQQKEWEEMKGYVNNKYWKKGKFDFIKNEYFNPKEEEQYKIQRNLLQEIQGKSQYLRIPPTVLYSDGMSYNIVNHEVISEERLKTALTMPQRSINRCKKSMKVNIRQRESGQREFDIAEERKLNRVSYGRWEKQIDRGYDFIKNTLEVPEPFPQRPQSVWDRVQQPESVSTGLLENSLSNVSTQSNNNSIPEIRPRASTSIPASREMPIIRAKTSGRGVPSLDLRRAEQPPSVTYKETFGGNAGDPIAMVRTGGGLNSIRN